MYGAPMKPSTVALPSTSRRSAPSAWRTKGHAASGSIRCIASTAACERIGVIFGPAFSRMSKSTPIPGSGVRMSEKRMTPSVWYAFHGCSEISVATSAISERWRKVGYFLHRSRYTFMCRPAWRIIHTGGRSTVSPRAARSSSGSPPSAILMFASVGVSGLPV